jgi:hypothetical protein
VKTRLKAAAVHGITLELDLPSASETAAMTAALWDCTATAAQQRRLHKARQTPFRGPKMSTYLLLGSSVGMREGLSDGRNVGLAEQGVLKS